MLRAALGCGLGCAALALLDPSLGALALPGALLATAAGATLRREQAGAGRSVAVALAWTFAVTAWSGPRWNADTASYYVYLRSLLFDGDLQFANDFAGLGQSEPRMSAFGYSQNFHAVGAALLWSPFLLLAHAYVLLGRLFGRELYAADGFSEPYLRALALGTGALVVGATFALARCLAPRFGLVAAALGVLGTLLASPLPYYVFVQPGMAHGAVYALAGAFLAAYVNAADPPTRRDWWALGLLLGLLAATRWQAAVFALFLLPLAPALRSPRSWRPALEAAGLALLAFSPQMLAWTLLFGSPLAAPARAHGMDWTSPHLADVLVSADRGLFSWTPLLALGLLGLLGLLASWPRLALPALAAFAASAWVNGGVANWAGADAFGARRFDLAVPLLAVGSAAACAASMRALARRPWLPAAALLSAFALWNLGLMRLYRNGSFAEAAPLEQLVARQARQLRTLAEAGSAGSPRLRKLAYDFFVGEYLYWNIHLDGAIQVGELENRLLREGWSPPRLHPGWGRFRWALVPQACLALPLQRPTLLRSFVRMRAPEGGARGSMSVLVNGRTVATRQVPPEWGDVPFEVPEAALVPGPNSLCFAFPHDGGAGEGAAAVKLVQLP